MDREANAKFAQTVADKSDRHISPSPSLSPSLASSFDQQFCVISDNEPFSAHSLQSTLFDLARCYDCCAGD